ncbi:NAD-dependent epimerase/dehydratase family protein [Paraburkholderia lycopersici]|uniref:UDP-glucose 4-epimerase n=1 Tax=Paraburkholderia lycopersici TaxID=416944 RepID=A0A1G6NGD7_9BURK|nr:NAD-dependent epimerase/dehydratase family protein [Paraburkholderia lycopersici]SDC66357.1 UDP-glucose 4-epimerase [Paraburkholderia lycopersici]
MSRILVTGATGFVGRAVGKALAQAGHHAIGLVRPPQGRSACAEEWLDASVDFGGLAQAVPQGAALDAVIHCAARVHVMAQAGSLAALDAFRATNVKGAVRVAELAHSLGARRMVFVSSIKAIAEAEPGRPLREDDSAHPQDAYGVSKREAELALAAFGRETGMEIVIVRPPLVYGPQVRANFLRLLDAVAKGWPLPLGAVRARRSLIYVDNLADALVHCAMDARAANLCFHVADSEDIEVAALVRALAAGLGRPARLVPVSPGLLRVAGRLSGKDAAVARLVGALRLDTSRIRATLGWRAPWTTEAGLAQTVRWYRAERGMGARRND